MYPGEKKSYPGDDIILAQMFWFVKVITHPSPLYPPFPKKYGRGEWSKKGCASGLHPPHFLFSIFLHPSHINVM